MNRWEMVELIRSRLADEEGTLYKEAPVRVALCYPSPYQVGMSSLGFQAIYREIHEHPGVTAQRAFLPEDIVAHRKASLPLFTYEDQAPVAHSSIIAFSIAYELEIIGVLEMLSLSGLPLLSGERDQSHPMVIAGGPLTFSNPASLEPFVDLIVLGEAEESIHTILTLFQESQNKEEVLKELNNRPGFHVTGKKQEIGPIAKVDDKKLPASSQIVTPNTELRSMFLVEAGRGCSRGCAYCVMRRTTNGGMRCVGPERIIARIPSGIQKVGLVGAAVTDHPQLEEILETLVNSGRQIGVSSLRAERLTPNLMQLLAKGGYRTLTVALDGASKRLRDSVNRSTSEEDVLRAAQMAKDAGVNRIKVYQMLGLPGETENDVDELANFLTCLSGLLPVSLGVAPFVAKRNTPLDGAPFEPINSLESKIHRLKRKVQGKVVVRSTSARWASVEYRLAQAGPEAGLAAMEAWVSGGSFSAWKNAFDKFEVQTTGSSGSPIR